jgi:hypothetical protein
MSLTRPLLTEDSWVNVPSHRHRRHWEVMRKVVMCRSIENIGAMLQRVRHSRRSCGWRPYRAIELAVALQDVRELLYHLVEKNVHSDMLLWTLDRAAGGQWRLPSNNESNGITTRDVAECPLQLELERGYTKPVEEKAGISDSSSCWEEGIVGDDFCRHTEWLCSQVVHDFCTTPLY